MQLESIFAGKPVKADYNGRDISTAIFKKLINGPVKVSSFNLEGDKQADLTVHGGVDKAVYAYPSEHYDFWKKERSDLQFQPGLFGENLSTTGLDETNTCIGDVYEIGSVVLQVTSPRMPCYKLGIRMNDSFFVRDFMKAEKNGFYFKVLQEGTIEAGNAIRKIDQDGHRLTVAEVIQLYTTRKSDKELLQKAVGSPSLPQDWTDHFEVMLHRL
ncbi:MOSC domain-containing protein [Ekhidna sp. To15]|uniref:MOSC domain-containing protein n=1 Tax=Ekhidna sp. To15 TaxID=3395267 RepID=UPI003F528659